MLTVEVCLTPTEFETLACRDLSGTTCVVFDVLRATTTMLTALANGAACIVPVAGIEDAVSLRRKDAKVLLAGERHGLRITAEQSGGVEFDLGNSPREFTAERIRGRTVVMTTTNGTRALQACMGARQTLLGGFVNLRALAAQIERSRPDRVLLVCSGTGEETALEDVLAAGALLSDLHDRVAMEPLPDSAAMALMLYRATRDDLSAAVAQSRNARRLLALPELREDVALCLRRDSLSLVAAMDREGCVRVLV